MAESRLDQLTEAQRECLRLVFTRHSSKEIAEIVGVSPSAVDKRIERAVQVLGVATRAAAARMLVDSEGGVTYERTPSDAFDLPSPGTIGRSASREPWWLARRLLGVAPSAGDGGEARNPLTKLQRLGVIVGLMFLISMTSMALLNMGQTLSSLARPTGSAPHR